MESISSVELQCIHLSDKYFLPRRLIEAYKDLQPGGTVSVRFIDLTYFCGNLWELPDGKDYAEFKRWPDSHWIVDDILLGRRHVATASMVAVLRYFGFTEIEAVKPADGEWHCAVYANKPTRSDSRIPAAVISKGEPYTAAYLDNLGYDYETHFRTELCSMNMSVAPGHVDRYLLGIRNVLTQFEHSLRSNWISALREANADTKLFLESDAMPVLRADRLERYCNGQVELYPDTDVIKLFRRLSHVQDIIKTPRDSEQYPIHGKDTGEYVWGSHAYWVVNRQKLIDVISNTCLPVDTAVEVAAREGRLNVRVPSARNMFWQFPHDNTHQHYAEGEKRQSNCLSPE